MQDCEVCPVLIGLPPGAVVMGAPEDERDGLMDIRWHNVSDDDVAEVGNAVAVPQGAG